MPKHTPEIVLVLYNVRSRFNVGAIFRTADAAGVSKIYLTGITPQPPHPKIDKVALGADKFIPFEHHRQTKRALSKLKSSGYYLAALEQSDGSVSYTAFKPKFPLALLLGSEVKGLPSSLLKECNKVIEIPMHGRKESLNVSIAAGITIFKIIHT